MTRTGAHLGQPPPATRPSRPKNRCFYSAPKAHHQIQCRNQARIGRQTISWPEMRGVNRFRGDGKSTPKRYRRRPKACGYAPLSGHCHARSKPVEIIGTISERACARQSTRCHQSLRLHHRQSPMRGNSLSRRYGNRRQAAWQSRRGKTVVLPLMRRVN